MGVFEKTLAEKTLAEKTETFAVIVDVCRLAVRTSTDSVSRCGCQRCTVDAFTTLLAAVHSIAAIAMRENPVSEEDVYAILSDSEAGRLSRKLLLAVEWDLLKSDPLTLAEDD